MNNESVLNLVQTPRELDELYGSKDYYWYLRSPPFVEAFIKPMATVINEIGLPCLDVGCGEAVLFDYLKVPYAGLEGSSSAIERANYCRPSARVIHGRIEAPVATLLTHFRRDVPVGLDSAISGRIEPPIAIVPPEFGTIVFGGLFSVIVNPERQVDFISRYAAFKPQFFIVYDLERTNTDRIDLRFSRILERHATAEIHLKPDVKRHRKILVYRWT